MTRQSWYKPPGIGSRHFRKRDLSWRWLNRAGDTVARGGQPMPSVAIEKKAIQPLVDKSLHSSWGRPRRKPSG